jgi:hypothetical protein
MGGNRAFRYAGEVGMKSFVNEAGWDRVVRVLVGLGLIALWLGGVVTGVWGMALGLLGLAPLLTGLIGFCPLYALFKFRTR